MVFVRKHYKEVCNNQNCQEKNTCQKRHPKNCKRYSLGNFWFKKECAFKHPSNLVVKDQCEIEQKMKFFENIVHKMALKLLNVEEVLLLLKHNKSSENLTLEINGNKEDLEDKKMYHQAKI